MISEQIHNHAGRPFLNSPDHTLKGPDAHCLPVKGYFIDTLQWATKETRQGVYAVERLNKPLLCRPAIEKLGLLMRIGAIDQDTSNHTTRQFPLLFKGLGKLQGEYRIKLQKGATPYALTCPRRVAIPFLKPVEQELRYMEKLGVITKVDHPTDWCTGMVLVPKTNGRVRICIDLTQLNRSVCREDTSCQPSTTYYHNWQEQLFFQNLMPIPDLASSPSF